MLDDKGIFDAPLTFLVMFLVIGVIGIGFGDCMINVAGDAAEGTVYDQSLYDQSIKLFGLGVTLCKCVIIISIAAIVFVMLQRVGLLPTLYDDIPSTRSSSSSGFLTIPSVQSAPSYRIPPPPTTQQIPNPQAQSHAHPHGEIQNPEEKERHQKSRWQAIDVTGESQ